MNLRDKILEAARLQRDLDRQNDSVQQMERNLDALKEERDKTALAIVAIVREMGTLIPAEPDPVEETQESNDPPLTNWGTATGNY